MMILGKPFRDIDAVVSQSRKPDAILRQRVNGEDIGEKYDLVGKSGQSGRIVDRDVPGHRAQARHLFAQRFVDVVPAL
ncbi:MAG: hypothetical protein MJE12_12960 [Alphaproteobacteria bacterium]|nr:hypothetical protein [Alphaproteobacteria bacterium]